MELRRATPADAAALARSVIEGFAHYRAFAPPGWEPPPAAQEQAIAERLLRDERSWTRVAEEDGRMVGQVSLLPAAMAGLPADEPGLAHLRLLFVAEPYWGTGLATQLLHEAVAEARARGFTAFRLFTPAQQARARRFYEREGWAVRGEPFPIPALGLDVVEYRIALT